MHSQWQRHKWLNRADEVKGEGGTGVGDTMGSSAAL